jgi:thioredoxin reductase
MVEGHPMSSTGYDVVIVGGGAAGLSAALVLGRARRRVAADLLEAGRAEVRGYGVELIDDIVDQVQPGPTGFTVRLAGGPRLEARRILVATGVLDDLPDIPGVRERWGRDLLHCPYCHGWEVRDQPLGVLGTRPDAVHHALLVRQWSDDMVFFTHTLTLGRDDHARLVARGVRIVDGEVVRLVVEADRLTGVELAGGGVVARTAVFVRPVSVPHPDGLTTALGLETDAVGFPLVDGTGRTSVPGVWAAGNAVDPRLQVITSAGAGSAAAIAINADLVLDDVADAVRSTRPGQPPPARPTRR